ncbi:ATP-dependent RNA helicase RhlB [Natronocella acetinitrilica]|uniref:ATP-dependent RNA helicase RhlB n=1 Tax=Natronocella acetinitrilica TaxID=414046 RepID=A0AAE3KCZ5_9GAMM|nr:DEAD/DEAH box helicase [Natronocella acetinitrilica]MCP1676266.1 ATP-dependent RNA helicase RhlB [Natronocella acetinitrilica]
MKNDHLSVTTFKSLGITQCLLDALNEVGFSHCTPIQEATLPMALQGRDLAGQAQTGTGKSAAFLLATMHYLMETPVADDKRGPWSIMLAPTRELALQIHKDAESLGQFTGMKFAAIYGGTGYEQQRKMLEDGVDIIIGTPGRIIDFYKQGVFKLDNIEVVVLDEADRMFDLGFIGDIRYLFRRMPPPDKRINYLFSATLSQRVLELAYEHMNDPEVVRIEPEQITAQNVTQKLYHVAKDDKIRLLLGLFSKHTPSRTIVFVNTKRAADQVTGYLKGNDFDAEVISGDIPQKKRESLLKRFQDGDLPILVATDVAARGLHIPGVSHVINFDLPQDAEDYVHRIGRTARAGESGDALSLACDEYVYSLPDIEAYIEQRIPAEVVAPELLIEPKPPVRMRRSSTGPKRNGGGGRRPRRPSASPN